MSNRLKRNDLKISRHVFLLLALLVTILFVIIFGAFNKLAYSRDSLPIDTREKIDIVEIENVNFIEYIKDIKVAQFTNFNELEFPTLDWLKLKCNINKNWQISTIQSNPSTLIITPKWKSQNKDQNQKLILALIPKQSEVYGVAISVVLDIFKQNDRPDILTVVNYGGIEAYGLSLLEQAKNNKVDLIMTVGSRATDFIYNHFCCGKNCPIGKKLCEGEIIPVVTNASKDPVLLGQIDAYENDTSHNIAFTSISPKFETLVTYLLQLKPSFKNIAILYAKNNISAIKTQVEPMMNINENEIVNKRGQKLYPMRVEVENLTKVKEELATLIPRAIEEMNKTDPDLENSIFFLTGSVSVYREIATINKYAKNVPIIATLPDVVQEGDDSAVLSIGAQMENVSYIASLYAIDILSGKKRPEDLKVGIVSPPDIAINFRQAKKINLKIPFQFFELASFIYDYDGHQVRAFGQTVRSSKHS